MNELLEIRNKIENTNEALSRLSRMLRDRPDSPGLLANMRVLERTSSELEQEFSSAAKEMGLEVCKYRLFNDDKSERSIFNLGRALVNFQTMFSVVYDAIKYGQPKMTQHLHEGTWEDTQFDFAYSYPGSIGVTMTLSSEVDLFGSPFDKAIYTMFNMAKVQTSDAMKEYSREVGVAPVKAMYAWADGLARADFGVDIKWIGYRTPETRIIIQKPDLISLRDTISSMSEEQHIDFSAEGILVAAHILRKAFGFQYYEGEEVRVINGRFIDAISKAHAATVPAPYKAHFRKTTRTTYSTDEDKIEYLLLRLEELEQ